MRGFGFPALMFGFAAAMIGVVVALAVYEGKQWSEFAKAHDCQVVGKISGHWSYGYYNGKYQNHWTPGKTVYKCNDGVEYTR